MGPPPALQVGGLRNWGAVELGTPPWDYFFAEERFLMKVQRDWLSKNNAEELRHALIAFWGPQKGLRFWLEPFSKDHAQRVKDHEGRLYAVRSNMVNGLPQRN